MAQMNSKILELQAKVDKLTEENHNYCELLSKASEEINLWKALAEKEQAENRRHLITIEEIEIKNKLLNDKLNGCIFKHAAVYKEKTINALMQSKYTNEKQRRSISPIQNPLSGPASANIYGGNIEPSFSKSPLPYKRGPVAQPIYHIRQSLDKKEYQYEDEAAQ